MSISTKPRVVRKNLPPAQISRSGFRQAYDYLVLDFEDRCAYSLQHTYRAGGKKCMEVDHFNPTKKGDPIQKYANLFLATRHCNGAKSNRWPTNKDRRLGLRFLNCCLEEDYGVHIFEDPDNSELVGVTPQGKYQVRNCDLNAPHLLAERAERAKLWAMLGTQPVTLKSGWSLPPEKEALRSVAEKMIPLIPLLSGKMLDERRAFKQAIAKVQGILQ